MDSLEVDRMKKITVVVPTYNEEKNIDAIYRRVTGVFKNELPDYICNIMFIDNCSTDRTRELIEILCIKDKTVTAIFNAKNFGFTRSQFYGLTQAKGDAIVLMYADMQDPPEVIPKFVQQWERGSQVVVGIKNQSKENLLMHFIREAFYKLIHSITEIDHISQYDGFGLYDRKFIDVLGGMNDNLPYLRGIVAELGAKRTEVFYEQQKRAEGKSKFRFMGLYDLAMLGITSYSKVVMHLCTIMGGIIVFLSLAVALYTLVMKLFNWDSYPFASAATQIGVYILGATNLFFIGLLGEYIVNMNIRIMQHPIVIEEKRINF